MTEPNELVGPVSVPAGGPQGRDRNRFRLTVAELRSAGRHGDRPHEHRQP